MANTDNLASALAKAQGEIKNAELNAENDHFKNKYANLTSIREAVTPALSKNGLAVTQTLEFRDDAFLLVTTLRHIGGETIESVFPLPTKAAPQQVGSAITYARRYTLAGLVGVTGDAEDDDGNAAQTAPPARGPARPAPKPTAPRAREPEPAPEKVPPIKLHKTDAIEWVDWGREYAAQIKLVETAAELAEWRKLNSEMMALCDKEAPGIHKLLTQRLAEADARLTPTGDPERPFDDDPFPKPANSAADDPARYLEAG